MAGNSRYRMGFCDIPWPVLFPLLQGHNRPELVSGEAIHHALNGTYLLCHQSAAEPGGDRPSTLALSFDLLPKRRRQFGSLRRWRIRLCAHRGQYQGRLVKCRADLYECHTPGRMLM